MFMNQLLVKLRKEKKLEQAVLAHQLGVSECKVREWENGLVFPTKDELDRLASFYDQPLEKFIESSFFVGKPYIVGIKNSPKNIVTFLLLWLAICLLAGVIAVFNWLPWLLLVIGLLIVLPSVFEGYWVIDKDYLQLNHYATNYLLKLGQLLTCKEVVTEIPYQEIEEVELIYRKKGRFSPVDIGPDSFYLAVKTAQTIYPVTLDTTFKDSTSDFLPPLLAYLRHQGVRIDDKQDIEEIVLAKESLYDTFNKMEP